MPQFMKKGNFGRMVEASLGELDSEAIEVRLSVDEYDELRDRLDAAEKKAVQEEINATQAKLDVAHQISQVTENLNRKLDDYKKYAKKEADRRVEQMVAKYVCCENEKKEALKKIEQLEKELERERNLNGNLRRVARERANASRGLNSKKKHDGYLVLSSCQRIEHYKHALTEQEYFAKPVEFRNSHRYPFTEHRSANVWKSLIQTPYDASIPLNQIRNLVEDNDLWTDGILKEIGCTQKNTNDNNGFYRTFGKSEEGYEINGMYKWKFNANYKSGFWEVEIYTTKSLHVPAHRRPVVKQKKINQIKTKEKKSQMINYAANDFDDEDYIFLEEECERKYDALRS